MLEAMRRLLTLLLLLAAVWTLAYANTHLLQIHPLDFASEQRRLAGKDADMKRLMGPLVGQERVAGVSLHPEAQLTRSRFTAAYLKGKQVTQVAGAEWKAFFDGAFATAVGEPPDDSWLVHYGSDGLRDYLYFAASQPPLNALGTSLPERGKVVYVRLGEGPVARYLVLDHLRVSDGASNVRSAIRNPYHHLTLWLVLGALLLYVLLPWPRSDPNTLTYARGPSVVGPDWLGFFVACSFFGIALLAISSDANLASILEENGWATVTAWCLLLCVPGLSLLAVAHWYAAFSLHLHDRGFALQTLFGARAVEYANVDRVGVYYAGSPTWLKVLVVLMIPASVGMAIPLVVLTFRTYPGLEITCRDGRVVRVLVSYLPGFERLVAALSAAGATLSPELQSIAGATAAMPTAERKRSPWRTIARVLLVLLLLALAGTATYRQVTAHYPGAPGITVPERAMTNEELAANERLAQQMQQAHRDLQAALERYQQATGPEKSAAYDAMLEATDRFERLSRQDDRLHERTRGKAR